MGNERSIFVAYAQAGDRFVFGKGSFTILWPVDSWVGKEAKDTNDTSIVGRFDYGTFSVLLTGDASIEVERQLIEQRAPLRSTVLKNGHHGSRTATSQEFLDAVHPDAAILSVGKDNRYGHPHREVVNRLDSGGMKTYRTDERGDIVIDSDGQGYTVHFGLGFRFW